MNIQSISAVITMPAIGAIAIALITGAIIFAILEHKGISFTKK